MIVRVKCIDRIRDKNGKITHYTLEDYNGKQLTVEAKPLKNAMYNKKIWVDNLKLTKGLKIIEAKSNTMDDTVKLNNILWEDLWNSLWGRNQFYADAVSYCITTLEKILDKNFVKVYDNEDKYNQYRCVYICGALCLYFELDRWKRFIYFNTTSGNKEIVRSTKTDYHRKVFLEFMYSCVKYSSVQVSLNDVHNFVDGVLSSIAKKHGYGGIKRKYDSRYVGYLDCDIKDRLGGGWLHCTCLENTLAVSTYIPYRGSFSESGFYFGLYYDIKKNVYRINAISPKCYRYSFGNSWSTFTDSYTIDVNNMIELRNWLEKTYEKYRFSKY